MRTILNVMLIFLALYAHGQRQFRFDHLTIRDGLSQNTVHAIFRDSKGVYWFGTQDGLNRYDGYTMTVFRHDRQDTTTISDNFILTILEDHNGNLWIGTRHGFNHFDKKTEKFTRIIVNRHKRDDYHNNIWQAVIDPKGNILFSNLYSQLVKIPADDAAQPPFRPEIITERVTLVKTSAWSYALLKPASASFHSLKDHRERWTIPDTVFSRNAIAEIQPGKALIGTPEGLMHYIEGKEPELYHPVFRNKIIICIYQDRKQNIWVGTTEGLYLIPHGSSSHETPVLITHRPDDPFSLGGKSVQSIYEDDDGLIWVGTSEGGVSAWDPARNIFRYFNRHSDIALSANAVWSIYQDSSGLWVGTINGLNHLVPEKASLTALYSGSNRLLSAGVMYRDNRFPSSVCGNSVITIARDKEGRFWFGTHNYGISVMEPGTGKWMHFNTDNSPLRMNNIFHIMCASDSTVWISTQYGFYAYKNGGFRSFLPTPPTETFFPSEYIMSSHEDRRKTIWVCTTRGLCHITPSGDILAVYQHRPGDPHSLSYSMATSCYEDSKGRFWVTTLGGGVNLMDRDAGTFRSYTQKDGLANDVTYRILEDGNGKLWISTNAGLSQFDPETETFINYSRHDGLIANEFAVNTAFINAAGELLFGTPEGIVAFHPDSLPGQEKSIPVNLTSVKVNYEPYPLRAGNGINLYYGDNTVSFAFAATDFSRKEKIRYAYMLEGFDPAWQETPFSARLASYTNLPFGDYLFRVRVRNGNHPWQAKELQVKVRVIPPFWLKPIFIALELTLVLLSLIALIKYLAQRKLKKRLREAAVQEKIHRERERISRDLHDNVGAHLTYIIHSLDNLSGKASREERPSFLGKVTALSDFTRNTMQQLRESIWAIGKDTISLSELRDRMYEYAGRMAEAAGMVLATECRWTEDVALKPYDAIHLYRIIQEAIHNAVKHSGGNRLFLRIFPGNDGMLCIEVEDNGKGTTGDGIAGNGLKNMKHRTEELNGVWEMTSGQGKGTLVRLAFPVQLGQMPYGSQ